MPHVTKPYHIKGAIKKPDPVGIYLAPAFSLAAHGVINDLNGFPVCGSIIYPVDDLLEFAILLVRPKANMKSLLKGLGQISDLSQKR